MKKKIPFDYFTQRMHEKLQDWSSQNFNESFRYHLWIKSLRNAFTAAKKKKTQTEGILYCWNIIFYHMEIYSRNVC